MILNIDSHGRSRATRYWSLEDIATEGQQLRFEGTEEQAAEALESLLRDAVRRRMVADVPLGAFLSGGIDSSTVVAMMQRESPRPVRTFSIGFEDAGYDEARHAAAVAKYLETEHTQLYASPKHALEVIPRLPDIYDEPFADSSQIPTYLVSKMTREHVTVALSGDGGDELFGGYTRYLRGESIWRVIDASPQLVRNCAAAAIRAIPPAAWSAIGSLLPDLLRPAQFGDKMHKLAEVLAGEPEASPFYRQVVSLWVDPACALPGIREPKGLLADAAIRSVVPNFIERMQYLDTLTYLPDDILTKVDRASMAVSLEARVPILDHRIVAFSWCLPTAMKNAGRGTGKRVLRRILHRHVPEPLVNRPKMGFTMPIAAWLRTELLDWAENLICERRLKQEGIFDPAAIRCRWREHLNGTRDWQSAIWPILMFQAWKARWIDAPS
jgi:asparagine synthase (glutamine-hydrolysing)